MSRSKKPDLSHIAAGLRGLAVPIEGLNLDPANARLHPEKNLAAIRASLHRFGQRMPIVVQKDGMVVRAGNGRVAAARELGWTHIAAVVVDEKDVEAVAFAIADNRTAELAEWDEEALAKLIRSLGADVELADIGFTDSEVEQLFREAFPEEGGAPDAAAEVDEDNVPARTKLGDLWLLGEHRLLCGDSRKKAEMARLMGPDRIDCLWTDPPYGVDYKGKTKKGLTIANDSAEGLEDLLRDVLACCDEFMRPGCAFYIAHPAGPISLTFGSMVLEREWLFHETLVWVNDSIVLGHSDYHYKHEPILYGWKRGAPRAWHAGRDRSTVLEVPRPKVNEEHPTMKPIALVVDLLTNSTKRGDVVLDPFSGSGTTILACQQLGRRGFGMELLPRYADVIVARWEKVTGEKAKREPA